MTDRIDQSIIDGYRDAIEHVEDEIWLDVRERKPYHRINGYEWCEEHDVPESCFATAVKSLDGVEYGVSPMYPWRRGDDT